MIVRPLLVFALLSAVIYGFYEIRRWQTPAGRETVSPKQRRLRSWGLFFLIAALGLSLRGTYLPPPRPLTPHATRLQKEAALGYMAYWTLTVLTTLPLFVLPLLDSRENLRRFAAQRQEERRKLLRETADRPSS